MDTTTPTITLTTPPSSSTSTPVTLTSIATSESTPSSGPPYGLYAVIVISCVGTMALIVVSLMMKYRKCPCQKTISEEIEERSRTSGNAIAQGILLENSILKAEVGLHGTDEEVILDAVILDEVKSANLLQKKAVEKEKEKELVDTSRSSSVTGKGTGIDQEMRANTGEICIDPTNTAVEFGEHEIFETNNNEAINAQTNHSDKNELKEFIIHCDGAEFTETIKENIETKDSKTNGTVMPISDEPREFEENETTTPISDETRDKW